MYESIMKVPLIIKYPKNRYDGTKSDKLVSNVDVGPTILNIAGLKTPRTMSGHALTDNYFNREYVFAENRLGAQAMVRSKRYKLIQSRGGRSLFFDLQTDPLELKNLYDDPKYQDEIRSHKQALVKWQGTDSLAGKNYLDEDAPVINQPNAVKSNDGHRDKIIEYFRKKMAEK
jgi:arylsulfatase A-like enzyme